MLSKEELRARLRESLDATIHEVNCALRGENLEKLEEVLVRTQIADYRLCQIAKKHREWLMDENEAWAQKLLRFLAYVNQSDWRAKQLLRLLDYMQDSVSVQHCIQQAGKDFQKVNKKRIAKDAEPIPTSDLESLQKINSIQPFYLGVIDAADNWVIEIHKDLARFPNSNEWARILTSPLDGQIGMSPALQWRYNFSRVFGVPQSSDVEDL